MVFETNGHFLLHHLGRRPWSHVGPDVNQSPRDGGANLVVGVDEADLHQASNCRNGLLPQAA
eukprot:CAMPEP_0206498814 /NCGR_PEP_ID=MMETSP0324_2-20121206/51281_1 /ASSEMBLY_ACC=CAM_ASM_000836 /TAXON_ID=2866 /ORGANISM="Crypthecodinium cohnii, Strain Seligo" /LENGTH=61 /DNA_ID=CAMNT_0053985199 /DNA_START=176 /DNA_END=361 /DNA_ORIENTATION=-